MKQHRGLFFISVLILALLGACNNEDSVSPSNSADESVETKAKVNSENIHDEIVGKIEKLNEHINEIKLPRKSEDFYLLPVSTATYSEEDDFSLELRLEQRLATEEKNSGLPLNIVVKPYSKSLYQEYIDQGYIAEEYKEREFLVHPDSQKSEIVFVEEDYLYNMNSSSYYPNVYLFFKEELMEMSFMLNKASEYKEFLTGKSYNYLIPDYFTNSEKEPVSIMVSYSNTYGFQNFNIEEQELLIRNETMQIYLTNGTNQMVNDVLINNGYETNYSEIQVGEVSGYLNHSEPYELVFEKSGIQTYIRPGTEVNENTGTVWTKEVPNWADEAEKTFVSFFDEEEFVHEESEPKQTNTNVETDDKPNNSSSTLFRVENDAFEISGISIGDTTAVVKETLGTPKYEGTDETGFYDWIQEYESNSMLVSFYEEKVNSFFLEVNLKEFEKAIQEQFQGEMYVNEEGVKYLYIPESEQLLMYSTNGEDSSIANISVMYADGNFHFWIENGGIKKAN